MPGGDLGAVGSSWGGGTPSLLSLNPPKVATAPVGLTEFHRSRVCWDNSSTKGLGRGTPTSGTGLGGHEGLALLSGGVSELQSNPEPLPEQS